MRVDPGRACGALELTADIILFIVATVLGATVMVLHLVLVWLVVRPGSAAGVAGRVLSVVLPPAAPVLAWRAGRRVAAGLWVVAVAAYVAVRFAYMRT